MKELIFRYLKNLWFESAYLNNEIFASLIAPAKSVRVLDLGCDNGEICQQRLKLKITKSIIYGVDIDPQKISLAKKHGIRVFRADLEKRLPFQDNYFDVITANQIIEHLLNTDNFIREIYRILKPEGYLIISTENLASWHNIGALFLGWHPFSLHASCKYNIGNPLRLGNYKIPDSNGVHIKNFTLKSLSELCQIYGFRIEKSYGAGYYPFPGIFCRILSKLNPNHTAFIGLKARKKMEPHRKIRNTKIIPIRGEHPVPSRQFYRKLTNGGIGTGIIKNK